MLKRKTKTKRSNVKADFKPSKIQQIDMICNDPFTKCLSYIGRLQGLKKIILSPNAQEFVGCRIGIHITSMTPWTFVKADKIRQNIELYKNISDFCSVKPFMERYQDSEVLLGCYNLGLPEQEQEFYICTTHRAKKEVYKILRKNKNDIRNNVYNMFSNDTLFWQTANENDSKRESNEIEINLPIAPAAKTLSTRRVQDAVDGYVEFLPTHEKYKNIMRRRIDNFAEPNKTENKNINTDKCLTKNMYTQYKQ